MKLLILSLIFATISFASTDSLRVQAPLPDSVVQEIKKEQRIEHEASAFHNPDINEKMWMAEKGKEPVGTAWNIKYGESGFSSKRSGLPSYIPSIEGVFNKRNGSNAGASYNYGNNHISHLAFDILPWLIMD